MAIRRMAGKDARDLVKDVNNSVHKRKREKRKTKRKKRKEKEKNRKRERERERTQLCPLSTA